MTEGFVRKTIQRSNFRSLGLAAFGFIVLVLMAFVLSRYYYNFLKGPFTIDQNELLSIKKPEDRLEYYLAVQGDTALDTGYQYVATSDNGTESVEKYYYALPIQDRLLLVRTAQANLLDHYTGSLISMPEQEMTEVIGALEVEYPGLEGVFLPALLDTKDFRENGYLGIGAAILTLILCAVLGITVLRRTLDPLSHPIMRGLAVYGNPELVAAQVEMEIDPTAPKLGSAWVTQTWLIDSHLFKLNVMRINDIVWIYKHVTTHRTYGIAVSKTFSAMVCDRNGKRISIQAKEAKVDELLHSLQARAPFALTGYDYDIEKLWRKNRQELVNEVDRRKRQVS